MAQQTFNVSENVQLEIRNCHNRVTVIGWDDTQHVSVDYAAREEGGTIIVENADKVMVRAPRSASIKVTECEADVRLEDLNGKVELDHIGGDVSLRNLGGDTLAHNLDGDLGARGVASLKGEGDWDGDVSLYNVKSFQAQKIEGALAMNSVETASIDEVEGDVVAKYVKSLVGSGEWEGDVVLRAVESVEIHEIEGDVNVSELGAANLNVIEGDLNAFTVRGALVIDDVKGDVNLREVDASVSIDRVEGDFIASGLRKGLRVVEVEGDAVVSVAEIAELELRADGDVVINLPENSNADIELDAPHGRLIAHADKADRESENHLTGTLGNGGTKIRVESARGDLILRAGGAQRYRVHTRVRGEEFADMGRRIAQEVRESIRESSREWGGQVHPKIKIKEPKIKFKKHWHGWDRDAEDREEEKPRGPAAGSAERQGILDAIARGELNVDDAIKKLRGEE